MDQQHQIESLSAKSLQKISGFTAKVICWILFFAYPHQAFADNQTDCRFESNQYKKSVQAVKKTNAYKSIERQKPKSTPIAFGGVALDKAEFLDGKCYLSVTVYISHEDRLELREILYVRKNTKNVFRKSDSDSLAKVN
jgi:hypothetical protein